MSEIDFLIRNSFYGEPAEELDDLDASLKCSLFALLEQTKSDNEETRNDIFSLIQAKEYVQLYSFLKALFCDPLLGFQNQPPKRTKELLSLLEKSLVEFELMERSENNQILDAGLLLDYLEENCSDEDEEVLQSYIKFLIYPSHLERKKSLLEMEEFDDPGEKFSFIASNAMPDLLKFFKVPSLEAFDKKELESLLSDTFQNIKTRLYPESKKHFNKNHYFRSFRELFLQYMENGFLDLLLRTVDSHLEEEKQSLMNDGILNFSHTSYDAEYLFSYMFNVFRYLEKGHHELMEFCRNGFVVESAFKMDALFVEERNQKLRQRIASVPFASSKKEELPMQVEKKSEEKKEKPELSVCEYEIFFSLANGDSLFFERLQKSYLKRKALHISVLEECFGEERAETLAQELELSGIHIMRPYVFEKEEISSSLPSSHVLSRENPKHMSQKISTQFLEFSTLWEEGLESLDVLSDRLLSLLTLAHIHPIPGEEQKIKKNLTEYLMKKKPIVKKLLEKLEKLALAHGSIFVQKGILENIKNGYCKIDLGDDHRLPLQKSKKGNVKYIMKGILTHEEYDNEMPFVFSSSQPYYSE